MAPKVKNGITLRWVINGFGTVLLLMILLEFLIIFALRMDTYRSVEDALFTRADALRGQILRMAESGNFDMESSSRSFAENFTEKQRMELQMVKKDGTVLYSSSGFLPEQMKIDESKDFCDAVASEDGYGACRSRSPSGEHVFSVCAAAYSGEELIGAVRCVASLTLVEHQLRISELISIGGGLLVLVLVALSGSYFVSSIVEPIKDLSGMARRIAMGDYGCRLKRRSDDEIGSLCDAINYMASEIEAAERMKNDFISSVSHELRTPLTAIKGWSETMQNGMDDPELMKTGMSILTAETDRLTRIVEELLDFSRMQNDKLVLQMQPVDLDAELYDAVLLMRERATEENVKLEYVENEGLPTVTADPARLKQVFINILDNAIKYNRPGGAVRVEAANMGQKVQIVISDTGMGISAEDLSKVKTKFFRADHSRPGTGIGLALADEIVRGHHGRMDIESRLGEGTTVTLTLPVHFRG